MAKFVAKCGSLLLIFTMMVVAGIYASVRILWEIITHPTTAFKKVPRDVPPKCLSDKRYGRHEYVTANGIKFHYVTAGDPSKPLMLFLHGFPEFWYSWRYQILEFSNDYHVVAIDMRGYGETEKPPNKNDYTLDKITQDVIELIPALGHSKCILVSHDWGGAPAWSVVSKRPELIEKFIVMNTPHSKVYSKFAESNFKQVLMSWYVFMFQWPWLPELSLSLQDFKMIGVFFKGKQMGLCKGKDNMTDEDLEAFKFVFSQPGALTPPLNYYRCVLSSSYKQSSKLMIERPILVIWGDEDPALHKDMADMHSTIGTNVTVRHIVGASHWVQQDAPQEVNQFMREFLQD